MKLTSSVLAGRKGHALSLLAGCAFPLGLAPLNLWPATLLSVGLFAYLLRGCTPKIAAYRGWFYGMGLYGIGVSWVYVSIHFYGGTPIPLAALMTVVFAGGLALLFSLQAWVYSKLNLSRYYLVTFPALWVLFEWLKTWLLSGFPWMFIGYGFIDTPLKH